MDKIPQVRRSGIPLDDRKRDLSIVTPDDADAPHLGIVGDTYTILLSGKETRGHYCLIDMLVPPGGGPGLHRHDFEEMFSVLEGEIELTFRGEKVLAKAGATVNIPANAPHFFKNTAARSARLLCVCTPAGQEEFFMALGTCVESRTSPPPKQNKVEQESFLRKAKELAPRYRTELLGP
jgi:quercetin dioxygenase-like cupin family protein